MTSQESVAEEQVFHAQRGIAVAVSVAFGLMALLQLSSGDVAIAALSGIVSLLWLRRAVGRGLRTAVSPVGIVVRRWPRRSVSWSWQDIADIRPKGGFWSAELEAEHVDGRVVTLVGVDVRQRRVLRVRWQSEVGAAEGGAV